jgi:hypothetical protein
MSAEDQFLRSVAIAETARESGRFDAALSAGLLASWSAVVAEITRDVLDPTNETDAREGREMLLENFQRMTQVMGAE